MYGAKDDEDGGRREVHEVEKIIAGSSDARQSKDGKKQGSEDSKKANQHQNAPIVGYLSAIVGVESRDTRPIVDAHRLFSCAPFGTGESSYELRSRQRTAGSRGVGGLEHPIVVVVPRSEAANRVTKFRRNKNMSSLTRL